MPEEPKIPSDALKNPITWEHAKLQWLAECENAERMSKRINLLLTGLIALFGLGFFKVEWFRSANDSPAISSEGAAVVVKVLV
ncbi:MAG: hypothetical protein DCC63_14880 [Nitrospira sp.]|nr:MAG: hypothetical protein DCC63_14880 [Nitrospira sp.]